MGDSSDLRTITKQLKVEDKPIRSLSPGERRALIEASPDDQWHAALYLAITTGIRAGELVSLTWGRIHWDKSALQLVHTKGKRVRFAYLDPDAIRLMRMLWLRSPKKDGQVDPAALVFGFGGKKQVTRVSAFRKGFARIVEAAGIERCTPHDLRRTFCTALAEAGVNQKLCQTLAGHASSGTTERYYQAVTDEAARAAASKVRVG